MKRLYDYVLEQSVLGNLLYVVFLLAGIFALSRMPVEEYPNESFDKVEVRVVWPGASAEDVERLVSRKIEDEVEDVKGIAFIRSTSVAGFSRVLVQFEDDIADFDRAYRDLESAVRSVRDLPGDAEVPEIERIDVEAVNPVVQLVVSGDDEEARKAVAEELERRIEAVPGVRRMQVNGVRDREVRVEVDPERLTAAGLTVGDVADALAARNIGAPGGVLRGGGAEVVVRTATEWAAPAEMLEAPLGPGGLRLRDVARIAPGWEDARVVSKYQGRRCALLGLVKATEANAIEIRELAGRAVDRFRAEGRLPPGIEIGWVADTTVRIEDRVGVLAQNVGLGSAFVFLMLGAFLGWRMSALALMGVAFAFLGTFVFLLLLGKSINVLSLFGLVLVSGMLVDDAVVVIENIVRRHEDGEDLRTAVVHGAAEVAWPVCSSVLTTIAAFLPLLLMTGVTGKFFSAIPIAVCAALAVSLFESITILPIHIHDLGTGERRGGGRKDRRFAAVEALYARIMPTILRRRYAVVGALLLTALGAAASLRYVPVIFFPSDFHYLFVNLRLPPDAALAETERTLDHVDEALRRFGPEVVESTLATAGFYFDFNYEPHLNIYYGQVLVTLARHRRESTKATMALVRERLAREDLGRAEIEVAELNDGPPIGRPVALQVSSDDLSQLRRVAREIGPTVAAVPGMRDVRLDLETGKREALATVDEERAAMTGVSAAAVARAIADANDGRIATKMKMGDDEWDVRVRAAPEWRSSAGALAAVRVRSRAGDLVPIAQVARIGYSSGYASIGRLDRRRTITVTGDVDPRVTSSLEANREIQRRLQGLEARERGLAISYGGEYEETNRSFRSLEQAFLIAMVAIFAILGAQFGSYVQPLIVMFCVPFALIGVVAGLHLTGDPFTIPIGLGIVGLCGVAVNDGIVMLDFANAERRRGLSPAEAISEAGPKRLRAIFLTSVTTIAGLLPSAVGFGGRSVVWGPMASALCFGLAAQMFLTLLVTPALYMIAEDVRGALGRLLPPSPPPTGRPRSGGRPAPCPPPPSSPPAP